MALRSSMRAVIAACFCGFAGTAPAQDLGAARGCASIAGDAARLACYDNVFKAMSAAAPQHTFGDTGQLPAQRKAEAKAQQSVPKTLDAKARAVVALPQGLYRITLDNDQVWVTRGTDWALDFHADDRVTITRMPLGGYQIALTGRAQSVSAKRIQ